MKPFFRMYCIPMELNPDLVDVSDNSLKELLRRPTPTRRDGWTLWDAQEVKVTDEGLEAIGYSDRRLMLLCNGCLEYWMPCLDEMFQWNQSDSERKLHPLLYPYALCELPVNFFRLARAVYSHLNLSCDVLTGLAFYSVNGFILRPYKPGIVGFNFAGLSEVQPYEKDDLKVRPITVKADFAPDHVAYDLIKQVYLRFGYSAAEIPFFDAEKNFNIES